LFYLYIKNMVCNRCTMAVANEMKKLGIDPISIQLGEATLKEPLTGSQLAKLRRSFAELGFEILDSPERQLIEKIKKLLITKVQSLDIEDHFSISFYLRSALNKDYNALSKLFSQVEGITVEQFFILQKIEKVKELLFYKQYNLTEVAWKLGYSSVQHLSAQFKRVTGLTPSAMKRLSDFNRKPLDRTH